MNTLQQLGLGLVAVAAIATSTQALSGGLHDKRVFQRSYNATIPSVGTTVATSGYRMYTDAHSYHRNYFTINTSMLAHASVFNSGRKSVEFSANGWEKGTSGRAVSGAVRINGKTVFSRYRSGYGATTASIRHYDIFPKEIGRGKYSFGVGPVSVTLSAGIDSVISPGLESAAANSNPYDSRTGWVRVIHRDSASMESDVSAGTSFWGFGADVSGGLKFIGFDTGTNPKDTKLTLRRSNTGNYYFNRVNLSLCTMGGKIGVWAKAFGITYNKTLLNKWGYCSNRTLLNIVDKPIYY